MDSHSQQAETATPELTVDQAHVLVAERLLEHERLCTAKEQADAAYDASWKRLHRADAALSAANQRAIEAHKAKAR